PNHSFMKGNIYYFAGNYEKAVIWMDIALNLDPNMLLAAQVKMACLLLMKKEKQFEEMVAAFQSFPFARHFQALKNTLDDPGNPNWVEEDYTHEFQPWELYFSTLSGNLEQAFHLLTMGLKNQVGQYFCFRYDPFLQPLRNDARYLQIVKDFPEFSPEFPSATGAFIETHSENPIEGEKAKFLEDLQQVMEENQPFLDPSLSLKSLADMIAIHPNNLSWLLNEHVGQNFNEFINGYRLETFKKKALDEANAHITLLGLAYESGFNSKTVFNTFFKKIEGTTPREWVRNAIN
ncbi:MAG: helix-turn-helix domain-containing protein, partial [Saprospiraceae bacterium]|nr:helix-turn-helix domain-containing protein [Saprospiraceae bacterium]